MNKYFFYNKKKLIIYMLLSPAMAITSVLFSLSLEPLITVSTQGNFTLMMKMIAAFMFIVIADMSVAYFHKISRENLRKEFLIALKNDLFTGIMNKSFQEFRKEPPSYYVSMMQRDVKKISTDYFDSVCGIYRVTTSFIVTVIALIRVNPVICFINVLIAMFSVFIPKIFQERLKKNSTQASTASAEYQSVISDALIGFNTIKLYSVFSKIKKQTEERNEASEEAECNLVKTNYRIAYISIMCSQVGYVMTIITSAVFVYLGKINIGTILALSQLIGGILAPFQEVPMFITSLKSVSVVVDKLKKCSEVDFDNVAETQPLDEDYTLKAENVQVCFGDKKVLKDVEVEFKQGKKYIIMGDSGCGKSTLVKLFLKMSENTKGRVLLGNKNISDIPDKQLYSVVNYMQQEVFLFDDTIRNNITLFKNYSDEELQKAIDNAGLTEYIGNLEDGVNTRINGNGYNLSGGEKQRIGIARALLAGAKVFILDEITSNLDVSKERYIEELIMNIEGVTVIMITHRINDATLNKADEVLVMKSGRIQERGTFSDLMRAKGLLYGFKMIAELNV
ncbi:ABC-type multidrug transport system, ATPase and permease component [Butyrivibrio fibrisolvens DSM 3071]|uniref:ABC-type multidrug transport system, ATPase and permease component n=1 Tax=Butyrivibrio fibrisolvens DSM 3071 TaxID=1121131 RepID=A0A1M6CZ01_BUTFI|nr:ABC transporter ATP-binding protein [Butyrivibrio fibrisolvens]SHI66091.1 ABC-type multidrug transport system, ATPase and permease component [Butyrivibrio fibrisolvens DSM 3071]